MPRSTPGLNAYQVAYEVDSTHSDSDPAPPTTSRRRSPVLAVDAAVLAGAGISLAGYLLPWFNQPGYSWSYSGWEYASLSTGGGWTLLTFVALAAAAAAGLWARTDDVAAMTAAVAAVVLASAVVAASFATLGEQTALNPVASLPFGVGLPLLAVGLGLLCAAACRAVARTASRPTRDR